VRRRERARALPAAGQFPYGAAHTSELQYLFDFPITAFPGVISPPRQQRAGSGDETVLDEPRQARIPLLVRADMWPRFGSASHRALSLTRHGRMARPASPPNITARLGLWHASTVLAADNARISVGGNNVEAGTKRSVRRREHGT